MPSELIRNRPGASAIKPASQDAAVPVAEGIWLSAGLSNSYLIVTDAGRVVINTGMGFESGHHRRLYDAVDQSPVRAILLTQGHVDHVGGVDTFREPGTVVVAEANNTACQADDARIHRFRVRRSQPYWGDTIAKADAFHSIAATGRRDPRRNRRPCLMSCSRTATPWKWGAPGSSASPHPAARPSTRWSSGCRTHDVRVRRQRLLGALRPFSEPRHAARRPIAVRTPVRGCGANRDRPRAGAALHRPLRADRGAATIRAELTRLRDAVQWVHDETVRGMNEGKDVQTLMREIRLPDELSVGEGYGKVAWGVRSIWEGYEGWFHARSTTELYGTPATRSGPSW